MANNSKKNGKKKTGPAKEQSDDLFHYTFRGMEFSLPKFGNWNFWVRRQLLAAKSQDDEITIALAGSADEEGLQIIDSMYPDDIVKLIVAWQRDAGISLGESDGSGES